MYKIELLELVSRGDEVKQAFLLEDRGIETKKQAVEQIVLYMRSYCDKLDQDDFFNYRNVSTPSELNTLTKKYKVAVRGATGDVYISKACNDCFKYFQIVKTKK